MQINAVKFRLSQNDEPITYKFSQSSGKFANFQSITGSPGLLKNISAALDFALTGTMKSSIFDAVLQASDHAGNTWIVHRTLSKVRVVKNGAELRDDQVSELHGAFFDHLDDVQSDVHAPRAFSIGHKKIVQNRDKLVAIDPDTADHPGGDIRSVLEEQIAAITKTCVAHTGLDQLVDPGIMIKLSQEIEPLYSSFREVCRQYKSLKNQKNTDPESGSAELASLKNQLEIIRHLEPLADKFLAPNFSISRASEDLAAIDSKIAEMAAALNLNGTDATALIKDFRKPVEALARLEMFAKLVRASQGARKYCEQKIEPFYKKYLEFADRNLASNRQIAAELDSCLSTLALKLKTEGQPTRESGQSLKTWFEKFKSKSASDDVSASSNSAQNDFDTARLAIEYAVSQLNEMASHLKVAVTKHESALTAVDDSHEALVAQYNQLRTHWIATANACGIPPDIDSTHMIKVIVAHGRLAGLLERRNQLAIARKDQDNDLMQIEDLIVRWREITGSQKSLDLSSPAIILREARDILRYKEARIRKRDQLRAVQNSSAVGKSILDHLKSRREEIFSQWEEAFAKFGMEAPAIGDKYNRELLKRASIVRGLALAWSSTPGLDHGTAPFSGEPKEGMTIYDTSDVKFEQNGRLEFLKCVESAMGGDLRILLINDEQLSSQLAALAIGSASRVVQAPAPAAPKAGRPTPVAKIIRTEKKGRTPSSQDALSERARQMLDLLSPRK